MLLIESHPDPVPFLAVFATAPQVCLGKDPAGFEPEKPGRIELRRQINIKTSVPIEKSRILSVKNKPLLVDDEHRYSGAVLALIKYLPGFVSVRIEIDGRLLVELRLLRAKIILIDRRREGKRCAAVKHDPVVIFTRAPHHCSQIRQRNFVFKPPSG